MGEDTVTVFGGGTAGMSLTCLLHNKGAVVRVWEFDPDVVERLNATRTPERLPHLNVSADIPITNDLEEACKGSRHWVVAVPSLGVRGLAAGLVGPFRAAAPETISIFTKGIEPDTGLTMSRVMESELGEDAARRIVALSGPSHAEEVSREMPTTVVAASPDEASAHRVQALFNTPRFRVYTGSDELGVELGAALKNVIAIAAGVCDGMGFGDNTRAALVTRGLAEMTRLGVKMGARPETFAGLTGMGDLIATAGSRHSRNRNFGELLGEGMPADEARERIGMVVEGVYAAQSAYRLAERHGVEMPISREVYGILYESKSPTEALQSLLARDPKPEIWQ